MRGILENLFREVLLTDDPPTCMIDNNDVDDMKIDKYEEIPLENLAIGASQVWVREVTKEIEDLAKSIKKLGFLKPVVVAPVGAAGKYKIITGQRRFLAAQRLGWAKIPACILDQKPSENVARAISLAESRIGEPLREKDYVDAYAYFYKKYGSIKSVSEELGVSYPKVARYVKFDQLIPGLKKMVENGDVQLQIALRAQRIATRGEIVEDKTAIVLASEMQNMASVERRRFEKVAVTVGCTMPPSRKF